MVLTEGTSLDLVSKAVDDLRLGANEQQTGGFDLLRELGVLREEPVSGVDHADAMLESDLAGGGELICGTRGASESRARLLTLMMSSWAR